MIEKPHDFQCRRCGACCRVPGYVELLPDEVERIANFLGLDIYEFTSKYAILLSGRRGLSLASRSDDRCIFLRDDNTCEINPVKPRQCREFPGQWTEPELLKVCAGLNPSP